MKSLNTQKGFTLVELAIVMTIIGLLIGGILKGQELMDNARVSATVAQSKGFEAAVTTFRDTYNAFPGDVPNANTRIPGCDGTNIDCTVPIATAGDLIVGDQKWGTNGFKLQATTAGFAKAGAALGDETVMFWMHLLQANLITGVNNSPTQGKVIPNWGITNPEAKIGGGWVVGYDDGTTAPGQPTTLGATSGISGTVLVTQQIPLTTIAATANLQVMTPSRAAQIDRKLDDGLPATGFVQAYGTATTCFNSANAYKESSTTKDCGVLIRIQN